VIKKISITVRDKTYVAQGPENDIETVVGLLFVQMLKDGVDLEEICNALRTLYSGKILNRTSSLSRGP